MTDSQIFDRVGKIDIGLKMFTVLMTEGVDSQKNQQRYEKKKQTRTTTKNLDINKGNEINKDSEAPTINKQIIQSEGCIFP